MKYVCSVCGYVYDDAEHDIPFAELPDSWTCPLCGAPKALFNKEEEAEAEPAPAVSAPKAVYSETKTDDLVSLSAGELSALFSNLARGCEKQYQQEAMDCFTRLSDYFGAAAPEEPAPDMKRLAELVREDLDVNYAELRARAAEAGDRGSLRAVTWGEKVTKMAGSLIDRYLREGEKFLENTGLYICTVCGFLYLGDKPPELCPVCKVPGWKFEKIDGRLAK